MARARGKISFVLNGVSYTDIPYWTGGVNGQIDVTSTGTAVMIRQFLRQKYGIYGTGVISVSSGGYDSVDIRLNAAPQELLSRIKQDMTQNFEQGYFDGMTDSYVYTKKREKADNGDLIGYGVKYVMISNRAEYFNVPPPDWDAITSRATLGRSSTGASRTTQRRGPRSPRRTPIISDKGTLLATCGGWELYRKTLSDGTEVINAMLMSGTPKAKNWDEVRGAALTDAGFTWNKRYQLFENRTAIGAGNMDDAVSKMCRVLRKYYIDDTATTQPTTISTPTATPAPTAVNIKDIQDAVVVLQIANRMNPDPAIQMKIDLFQMTINAMLRSQGSATTTQTTGKIVFEEPKFQGFIDPYEMQEYKRLRDKLNPIDVIKAYEEVSFQAPLVYIDIIKGTNKLLKINIYNILNYVESYGYNIPRPIQNLTNNRNQNVDRSENINIIYFVRCNNNIQKIIELYETYTSNNGNRHIIDDGLRDTNKLADVITEMLRLE
jgi:hypothetical protein